MIAARDATLFQKGRPVSTQVFKARRGRITLTDEKLIYEHWYERPFRISHRVHSVARADITEVHFITHVHWLTPTWIEVIVRHRGGVLNIPHMAQRTAERLRKALGF
jgi:hypothetical protein